MKTAGKLVLIIGPSGVGKSVILNELKKRNPELYYPRSATTRKKREGEGNELYYFVTDKKFDQLVEAGQMLEWAVVHGGARYGTLRDEIIPSIEDGRTVVREVDVQGFDSITNHKLFRKPKAPYKLLSVFILPENKEQLIMRITKRAPIAEDELRRRLSSMEKEMAYADLCDYRIINRQGKLEETLHEAEKIINKGE